MIEITCYHSSCLSPLEARNDYFYNCKSCGKEIYTTRESICRICGSPMLLSESTTICSNPYCPAYSFRMCTVCKCPYDEQHPDPQLVHSYRLPVNFPSTYNGTGCLQIRAFYDNRVSVCLDLTKADFSEINKSFIQRLHKQWIKETLKSPSIGTRKRYATHGSY